MNKQQVIDTILANKALLEEFSVKSISVFGSVVRDEAQSGSDVDFLVDFKQEAGIGLFEFIRLKNTLSDILGVKVDLVTPDALHPALKDDILQEAHFVT